MPRRRQRVTIEDVAREAGVSSMTVSRVINDAPGVSAETRVYVREIIARLDYRPSRIARSLATNKTYMIGLVVPDITNPYFSEIVQGAEQVAWELDYSVLLANFNENPAREEALLIQLEETGVDGVILVSSRLPDDILLPLIEHQKAVVTINRVVPRQLASSVYLDPQVGLRWNKAIRHLVATGHKHIPYLCLKRSQVQGTLEEYLALMIELGLRACPEWYVSCAPNWDSGYARGRWILETYPEIDALVGGNDLVALGAMRAALELGRCIPDDLAIIGGDGILMAREVTPSLTTFRAPLHDMGAAAARLLFKRIAGNNNYEEYLFSEEFIIRESAP